MLIGTLNDSGEIGKGMVLKKIKEEDGFEDIELGKGAGDIIVDDIA